MYDDPPGSSRGAIVRDLLILQIKLVMDGVKGALLSQAAILTALAEMVVPPRRRGRMFYRVLALGERFDLWLNLYGAARRAQHERDGLFAASRAGDDTLLGQIEELVHGQEPAPARPAFHTRG